MANFLLPKQDLVKPAFPIINQINPLASGLTATWLFNDAGRDLTTELVRKIPTTISGSVVKGATRFGNGLISTGSTTSIIAGNNEQLMTPEMTYLFDCELLAPHNNTQPRKELLKKDTPYIIDFNSNGFLEFAVSNGSYQGMFSNTGSFPVGRYQLVFVNSLDLARQIWINGSLDKTGSYVLPAISNTATTYLASDTSPGTSGFQGVIHAISLWNRGLRQDEINTLWRDPWGLYRPTRAMKAYFFLDSSERIQKALSYPKKPLTNPLPNYRSPLRRGLILDMPLIGPFISGGAISADGRNPYTRDYITGNIPEGNAGGATNNTYKSIITPFGPGIKFIKNASNNPSINFNFFDNPHQLLRGLNTTNGLSLEAILRVDDNSPGGIIFFSDSGGGSGLAYFSLTTTNTGAGEVLQFLWGGATTNGVWQIARPDLNTWNHLIITRDNSTASNQPNIYINGVRQSIINSTNPVGAARIPDGGIFIGSKGNAGTLPFVGVLVAFRLWNRILSQAEVYKLQTNPWQIYKDSFLKELGKFALSSQAGVIFDAASSSAYEAALSTYSWNHTVANQSNRILIVSVSIFASGSVSSITYNGVALTKNNSATITNGIYRSELWYLINPATGTNQVSVTLSASLTSIANAASYYNVDQTTPIEATATNTGTGNPASATVTTVAVNSRIVANLTTPTNSGVTSAAGQNSRALNAGALGSSALDDKGPVNPAGSSTITWNGIGVTDTWAASIISLQIPTGVVAAINSAWRMMMGMGL